MLRGGKKLFNQFFETKTWTIVSTESKLYDKKAQAWRNTWCGLHLLYSSLVYKIAKEQSFHLILHCPREHVWHSSWKSDWNCEQRKGTFSLKLRFACWILMFKVENKSIIDFLNGTMCSSNALPSRIYVLASKAETQNHRKLLSKDWKTPGRRLKNYKPWNFTISLSIRIWKKRSLSS